jgi:hypothetical protein
MARQVRRFAPDGKPLPPVAVPDAFAIAIRTVGGKERALVVANPPGKPVDRIAVIEADGTLAPPITLEKPVRGAADLAVDSAGDLYVVAEVSQVWKFSGEGRFLAVLGAATKLRAEDGSELLHTVAVDSKGRVYTMGYGNPGLLMRFEADHSSVVSRGGQFKWADPWSVHAGYVCFAVDRKDRLWVGITGRHDPKNPNSSGYHFRPAVVRTEADFFDAPRGGTIRRDTITSGLRPEIEVRLPYNVGCELKPVAMDFVMRAGNRRVQDVSVRWTVRDMYRAEAASGSFDLPLVDGAEARHAFSFTPPRWGWYLVSCALSHKDRPLMAVGAHVGLTPPFPGMPVLAAGDSAGGWNDAPRWAFCGHMVMRIHPTPATLEKMAEHLDAAAKYGMTVVAQLSDANECTPEFVRAAVGRYKGRIKYWEIWNEPNFRMGPDKYAAMVKDLTPIIRELDPAAKVLGPTVCGVNLGWHEGFYKAGGGPFVDILSIHDYEGHEGIDPVHWTWKLGALRKLMAAHGDAGKPIWQTERAISGVRGAGFIGPCQAVRVTLHRDLLETLGIPPDHNILYYLNEGGYTSVPSYIWSKAGPHPAALALRTRHAMTAGRTYGGTLDFGPTGNRLLMGLRYKGTEGSTVVLRNLGMLDRPVGFTLTGGDSLEVVDSFGNPQRLAAVGGRVSVVAGQMPSYLRLAPGQDLAPDRIDFGSNLAAAAGTKFTYSAACNFGKPDCLNNGVLEVTHDGNPNGAVSKPPIFTGELPTLPQTLEIGLDGTRTVSRMLVFGLRADNAFCALLDYDLQYHDGRDWATIEKVRTPCPPCDAVRTPQCDWAGWYLDNNLFVHEFRPVKTDRLRLVVLRTTHGYAPDDGVKVRGQVPPAMLMLREIEVYE